MAATGSAEVKFDTADSAEVSVPIPDTAGAGDMAACMLLHDAQTSATALTADGWTLQATEISTSSLHTAAYLLTRDDPLSVDDIASGVAGVISWDNTINFALVVVTNSGRSGTVEDAQSAQSFPNPSDLELDTAVDGADLVALVNTFNAAVPTVDGFDALSSDTTFGIYTFGQDDAAAGSHPVTVSGGSDQWFEFAFAWPAAAAGGETVDGHVDADLGALATRATGRRTVHGSASAGLAGVSSSATSRRTVHGSSSAPLGDMASAASAQRSVHGEASLELGSLDTQAVVTAAHRTGTASVPLAGLAVGASGRRTVHGRISAALGGLAVDVDVAGDVTPYVPGGATAYEPGPLVEYESGGTTSP